MNDVEIEKWRLECGETTVAARLMKWLGFQGLIVLEEIEELQGRYISQSRQAVMGGSMSARKLSRIRPWLLSK